MKVFRIFPYTGTNYSYIQHTGFRDDIVFDIIDGYELNKLDFSSILVKNISKKNPDLLGTGSSEFFISENFKKILKEHIHNQSINFIPVVLNKQQYYLLNIIGLRDAMDLEKSKYSIFESTKEPDEIQELVLKENTIDSVDIFRLKEDPIHIFITEELMQIMVKKKLKGIRYIETMDLRKMNDPE